MRYYILMLAALSSFTAQAITINLNPVDYYNDFVSVSNIVYDNISSPFPAGADYTATIEGARKCSVGDAVALPSGLCIVSTIYQASTTSPPFISGLRDTPRDVSSPDNSKNLTRIGMRPTNTLGGVPPGTYNEFLGNLVIRRLGSVIITDPINVNYTILNQPCSIDDELIDFGDLTSSDFQSGIGPRKTFNLIIRCPNGVNANKLAYIINSSLKDGDFGLDSLGGNVQGGIYKASSQIKLGTTQDLNNIQPGLNTIPLEAAIRTAQGQPPTPGNFNIIFEVSILYQ